MELDRETRLRQTREAWGAQAADFRFLDAGEEETADRARDTQLAGLADRVAGAFGGSKPHVGPLSPGCRRCGEGRWSCLFVTRECDASCAFCPAYNAPGDMLPWADGLTFPDFDDFLAYVRTVGACGVSFSGGEPFLRADRLVDLVRRTRAALGADGWIWVYTNGRRATAATLARLVGAGLDEVRFNVAASGYRLDGPARAVGVVPTVTVEVPVVPEDEARLRAAFPEMARLGVDHVNLHETMLYGMNTMHVHERGYRLRNGTVPTLADAEPGALRLLRHVVDEGLDLAVQYCAQVFKGRWQMRGNDARVARLVARPDEVVTAWGLLRRVEERGGAAVVQYLRPRLADEPVSGVESRPLALGNGRSRAVLLFPVAPPQPIDTATAAALADGRDVPDGSPLARYERIGAGLTHGLP